MATLLEGPWRERRDGRAGDLAGRLDPLTLALYQWRVASNAYDLPDVIDALAGRLAVVVTPDGPNGVEWCGPLD